MKLESRPRCRFGPTLPMRAGNPAPTRGAYTLIELLVVIAIIGVLIALLLPAIQASREAARNAECKYHLQQIGLAAFNHESTRGHYPTGGWGGSWTGDPDRGFDKRQPGGWVYNILPFLEETARHKRGAGLQPDEKRSEAALLIQEPLRLFHCPTRRPAILYPNASPYAASNLPTPQPEYVARSDYAINAGDRKFNTIWKESTNQAGPSTLEAGDGGFAWPSTSGFTGISFLRSEVRGSQVTDGTAHTYLIGEVYLSIRHYSSGSTGLNDAARGHLYIGFAPDTVRLTGMLLESLPPKKDGASPDSDCFGSAHNEGCNFVFCDGSVRTISYDIDAEIHRRSGNRKDGQ